jgi:hypothetical protein
LYRVLKKARQKAVQKKSARKAAKKLAKTRQKSTHNTHANNHQKKPSKSIFLNLSCCCLESGLKSVMLYKDITIKQIFLYFSCISKSFKIKVL